MKGSHHSEITLKGGEPWLLKYSYPLIEMEVTTLFLNTLQEPYYDRLMPTATGSFANMIKVDNLIDHVVKNIKIDIGKSSSKPKGGIFAKKKEGKPEVLF